MNDTSLKADILQIDVIYRALFGIGIFAALFMVSRHNYLVFHTLAEFFSIAVAWSLFLVFWNTRSVIENKPLIILGIGYLFIGSIDLMHTLSYKGMGVLSPETGANPATQLWIFARYMESLTLCVFASMRIKEVNAGRVILFFSTVVSLGLLSIFYWENFPVCYIDGVGLTKFKIFSEYLICAILTLALLLLKINKALFDQTLYRNMVTAIILTMFAELAFTFYVSVYGLSNLLGHYFKIVSFYFVYRALIWSGLTHPYATLFRNMVNKKESLRISEQELRKSEQRFQRAMDASQDGVYNWDLETKEIYYSPGWKRMLGYEPDELPNDFSVWEKLTHPDDVKASWTMMNEVVEGARGRFEIEFRMKHKNCHWVDILSRSNRYKDDLNGRVRIVGTHVDISKIKKIERELKARGEEHRSILETAMDGFWIVDTAGRFLKVNETYCEMSGYSEQELLRMDISAVEDVEKAADTAAHMQKVMAEGQDRFESRHRRKDGSVFDVEVRVQYRPLDEPQCVVFIRDITERKRAEETQRLSEEKIRNLVESTKDWVWEIDIEGVHTYSNNALSETLGYSATEIMGGSAFPLMHPDDRQRWKTKLPECMANKMGWNNETIRWIAKNGDIHWFESTASPVSNSKGTVVGFRGIDRDITDRMQTQEALEKRMIALTRPLDHPEGVSFEDLFNLDDIQRLQDQFSSATGVASIITTTDGTPITQPSNFCRLCNDIIRKTDKGIANCFKSDAVIGRWDSDGPTIQPCLSGGLWDAGAGISVGGRHIANWLIGQVRDDTQTDAQMQAYANEIGADEEAVIRAFHEVPAMSREKFGKVAQALYTLANQLSDGAYRNMQQARFINDKQLAETALKESKIFLENISDIAYTADNQGNVTWVNAAIEQAAGLPMKEIIGKPFLPLFIEEDHASLIDVYTRTLAGEILDNTLTFTTGVTCHFTSLPNKSKDGRITGTFGVARDISERLAMERELQESEARLKKAQTMARVGNWEYDIATGKVWGSEEAFRIYGIERKTGFLPLDEVESRIIEPERVNQALSALISRNEDYDIEYMISSKSRERLTVLHSVADLIYDPDGKPLKVAGVIHDITDIKRLEVERQQSEETYRNLMTSLTAGVVVHAPDTSIMIANPASAIILGLSEDQLLGKQAMDPQWKFLREDGSDMPLDEYPVNQVLSTNKPLHNLVLGVNRPQIGDIAWALVNGFPVYKEAGSIEQVVINFVDITDRKQAEVEKEKLESQLRQAQKMESVGRLAGGVAHDFNNMLSVILGNTELAMENMAPDDPLHNNFNEIFSAAKHSADITRQLLAFARKQTIAPKVLDLNRTIKSMLKMLRRLIGEDIDLAWLPEKKVWPVRMDPSQIDQILANLCINARDAIADVGKITIETETATFDSAYCAEHPGFVTGDFVLLAVSDDGSGMDQETLANLFEPFFTTKGVEKGTGLGLATVYGIVKQNDGFINVYSEPDQGTTFRIYLPRYRAETEILEKKPSDTINLDGTETILLVEDEPSILQVIRMMLERTGYKVLAAGTPGEAISLAREHAGEIQLLMTDVVMPEMNGRDLARNLLLLYPDLKRLFMSGYTANVIAHHGVLDEGVQFIQKPFAKQDLAIKVREVLDEDNL